MTYSIWQKFIAKCTESGFLSPIRVALVLLIMISIAPMGFVATAAGTWATKTTYPATNIVMASAEAIGGKIYVVGGSDPVTGLSTNSLGIYNSATDTWASGLPMPSKRLRTVTGVIDGKLYVAGGLSNNITFMQRDSLEIYDPATDIWTTGTPMPAARDTAMGGVIGGKMYVVGGSSGCCPSTAHADLFVYDPATNTWATKAPMAAGTRFSGGAGVVNGKLYVAGGETWPSSPSVTRLEEYDPATDTWITKAPMPGVNHLFATGVINNKFYVIGGRFNPFNDVQRDSVWVYDPASDSWTVDPATMPTARSGSAPTVLLNQLHIIGGFLTPPAPSTNVHEVYIPAGVPAPSAVVTVDFDSLDTTAGRVSGAALDNYLAGFGITITSQVGATLTVASADPALPNFGGQNVVASSSPNVLEMFPGNTNVSFTLEFSTPIDSLSFTRAARCTSLAYPPWDAVVKNSLGVVIGTASESGGGTGASCASPFPPAQVLSFTGPGIKSLTIDSGNFGFYGRQGPALDDLVMTLQAGSGNHPPVANAGANQTVQCSGASSADVTLNGSASDLDPADTLTYNWSWAGGGSATGTNPTASFPRGATTVTLTVSDGNGGSNTATTVVTVEDTTAPVVNAGADVTLNATGPGGAVFDVLTQATSSDNCCGVSLTVDPVGSYPIGTTPVTVTATDCASNHSSDQMNVIVNEVNSIPNLPLPYAGTVSITTPPGQTLFASTTGIPFGGPAGISFPFASVAYSVTSPVGGSVTVTLTFSSALPTPFLLFKTGGVPPFMMIPSSLWTQTSPNSIQITLTDGGPYDLDGVVNGVIIDPVAIGVDTDPPVFSTPPIDITGVEATSVAGAVVTFSLPVAVDNIDPNPVVSCLPASGSTFGLGSSTVTCTATDASNNSSSSSFTVTVLDTTPPVLTVPVDVSYGSMCPLTPVAIGQATATDFFPPVIVTSDAPLAYGQGTTTVIHWTAEDANHNSSVGQQNVTVVNVPVPVLTASLVPYSAGDEDDQEYGRDSDEGRFIVHFAVSSMVNVDHVTAQLVIAGYATPITVTDGQIIEFEYEDEKTEVEVENGVYEIEAPAMLMRVTAVVTESCASDVVAEAQPQGLTRDNDDDYYGSHGKKQGKHTRHDD
ncbi:HYR domain-containing protein [Mariprofundus sp. EBB-1]|uniref:Kelch repeat-containing protein n=1 Tax=Mariprofundus sp. EBB-1 TaxID=2650971 RepID=UPI000EF24042|nr:choice-of-anchor U domain-containing protein [Mariprofundus sp. EBB-1]RLL54055.1 HYR domain-containing protein [Mariprofundus sp. EBB-1]